MRGQRATHRPAAAEAIQKYAQWRSIDCYTSNKKRRKEMKEKD